MRDDDTVWTLAEEAGVTCFGMSTALLHACSKAGVEPGANRDLGAIRAVGSTGRAAPAHPRGLLAAARPQRGRPGVRGPAHAEGKVLEVPVEES